MREIRVEQEVIGHAIVDAINTYIRDVLIPRCPPLEAVWDESEDTDLKKRKYEIASIFAAKWSVSHGSDPLSKHPDVPALLGVSAPYNVFEAIDQHDLPQLAAFLAAGADPNVDHPDQPSWTPLKLAVSELEDGGPIEAVVVLLRHGALADGGGVLEGITALLGAASDGQLNAARLLLAAGADPNVRTIYGDTPLCSAIGKRDHAMADLLLLCGADIYESGFPSGNSPLGFAVWGLVSR